MASQNCWFGKWRQKPCFIFIKLDFEKEIIILGSFLSKVPYDMNAFPTKLVFLLPTQLIAYFFWRSLLHFSQVFIGSINYLWNLWWHLWRSSIIVSHEGITFLRDLNLATMAGVFTKGWLWLSSNIITTHNPLLLSPYELCILPLQFFAFLPVFFSWHSYSWILPLYKDISFQNTHLFSLRHMKRTFACTKSSVSCILVVEYIYVLPLHD